MPDYSKSKIYKLTSTNTNEIYIGSTVNNLSRRKAHHINDYKLYLSNKKRFITSFKIIEYGGDINICLLEEYPCDNKEQLHQRERFYIENNICVNKFIPTRTRNEYNELNKEKQNGKQKEYYELNKDKINELNRERAKIYYKLNKDKIKEYKELNKYNIKEKQKEYYQLNKDKIKEYHELNKDKINEKLREQYRIKMKALKEQQMI